MGIGPVGHLGQEAKGRVTVAAAEHERVIEVMKRLVELQALLVRPLALRQDAVIPGRSATMRRQHARVEESRAEAAEHPHDAELELGVTVEG